MVIRTFSLQPPSAPPGTAAGHRRRGWLLPCCLALLATSCGAPAPDERQPTGTDTQALSLLPYLPWPAATTMGVSQGQFGTYSHTGSLQYAIDFNIAGTSDRGIHVLAVGDGAVTYRHDGCACDGCSCNYGWGNAIVIDHGSGEYSKYAHLEHDSIPDSIQAGTEVCRGLFIGTIGSTGNSTGPHLHFQFQSGGGVNDPSIDFERFYETTGVPVEGGSYVSQNQELSSCPSCSDECALGDRRCNGAGFQVCGDHDADPCLDWGSVTPCSPGTHCEGAGQCVPGGGGFGGGTAGFGGTSATGGAAAGGGGLAAAGGAGLGGGGTSLGEVDLEPTAIVGECSCRLADRTRRTPARSWPLLLLVLAAFARRRQRLLLSSALRRK